LITRRFRSLSRHGNLASYVFFVLFTVYERVVLELRGSWRGEGTMGQEIRERRGWVDEDEPDPRWILDCHLQWLLIC